MHFDPQTLEELQQQATDAAEKISKQVEADVVLHELLVLIDKVREKCSMFKPAKVHVLYEHALITPGFVEELLAIAGAVCVPPEEAQILLAVAGDERFLERQIAQQNWQNLQAVQHERTFTVSPAAVYPTPSAGCGLRQLAKLLHGIEVNGG